MDTAMARPEEVEPRSPQTLIDEKQVEVAKHFPKVDVAYWNALNDDGKRLLLVRLLIKNPYLLHDKDNGSYDMRLDFIKMLQNDYLYVFSDDSRNDQPPLYRFITQDDLETFTVSLYPEMYEYLNTMLLNYLYPIKNRVIPEYVKQIGVRMMSEFPPLDFGNAEAGPSTSSGQGGGGRIMNMLSKFMTKMTLQDYYRRYYPKYYETYSGDKEKK